MIRRASAVFGFALMVGACSASGANEGESDYSDASAETLYGEDADVLDEYGAASVEREPFDEDAAREAAGEQVSDESYSTIGAPYGCTDDCSGHEAGFAWRRDNGYATAGNSQSFDEGGRAFDDAVEDRVEEMRSDYESGDEPEY